MRGSEEQYDSDGDGEGDETGLGLGISAIHFLFERVENDALQHRGNCNCHSAGGEEGRPPTVVSIHE